MEHAEIRSLLLDLPEVTESEPFRPGTLVYKVVDKVFVIYGPEDDPARLTLKCDPARALHLRDEYPAIVAGYHVNKRLWNTVSLDGTVPDDLLAELLRHAYEQAAAGLRKADRDRVLASLEPPA